GRGGRRSARAWRNPPTEARSTAARRETCRPCKAWPASVAGRGVAMFNAVRRRKWKMAVNRAFRRQYGVDLRTVGGMIGSRTLRHRLNDEYELVPQDPVLGAENVAQMLAHVYRVDVAAMATRDFALTMVPMRGSASPDARPLRDAWSAHAGRD